MNPFCNAVSAGYFKTMGIPLVAGRDFDDRDARSLDAGEPDSQRDPTYKVAIVNESYAKHYFGTRSPIGRHRLRREPRHQDADRDHRRREGREVHGRARRDPAPSVFAFLENDFVGSAVMHVRTTNQPDAAFGAIRQAAPARRQPADLQPAHARAPDRSIAPQRPADCHAVHGIRRAGDLARGHRPLRRDGARWRGGRARLACAWRSARCRATSCGWSCARCSRSSGPASPSGWWRPGASAA